jgi:proteasome accessory factor C
MQSAPGFVTARSTERMRGMMADLAAACESRRVAEIDYYSAHRAKLALRRVHPFELVEIGAHFYLFAWCELAADTRHFRLDRIRTIRVLDQPSNRRPPPRRKAGRMEALFEGKPKDHLRIRFSPAVSEEIADEWKDSPNAKVKIARDGSAVLQTPLYNQFWAIGYVMAFGEHARLIEPKWLRVELGETIRKSLQAHE